MKNFIAFLLFMVAFFPNSSKANPEDIEFKLEAHQKLVGTYSGDIDQQSSIHLAFIKDKNSNEYKIRPFFINEKSDIISLQEVTVSEEPSVVSFHYNTASSNLTLLLKQGQRKAQQLEIIDLNILTKEVRQRSLQEYEDAYLMIRAKDRTFLIYKEKDGLFKEKNVLDIKTVYDSQNQSEANFTFNGVNRKLFRKIFETKPQIINTNELVENGSINVSKVYFYNNKLIFDHTLEDGYTVLSIDPEKKSGVTFKEFDLENAGTVREISSYLYGSKIFLFVNNKKDINLRTYDLGTGELITDVLLQEELADNIDLESMQKIIKKSSRNRHSLTGTVNEGPENSMVVTLDYVTTNNYNYHYNWWWQHQFLHQQMMWQQQMMQQHMRMQTQMRSFGPSPDVIIPEEFSVKKTQPVQFVIDKDFNFLKGTEVATVRPKIDKDKHVEKFEKDRRLKDVSLAFTKHSGRAIYFSKSTDSVHIINFEI